MAEFPALPLWTDAYLSDTRHLSTLEHGAYLLLMMEAWRRPSCSLPNDDRMLARLAGLAIDEWMAVKDAVMEFWKVDNRTKTITQKRLSKERVFVVEKSAKQRERIASRWNKTKNEDTTVLPEAIPDGYRSDTPTPTPTPIKDKKEPSVPKKGTRIPADFQPDIEWAVQEGLSPQQARREAANFIDYWTAKSGKDATKMDWPATWRTWVRKKAPGGGARDRPKSAFQEHQDRATATLERALNRGSGHEQRSRFDDGQPAFDLAPGDFRSDRKTVFEGE